MFVTDGERVPLGNTDVELVDDQTALADLSIETNWPSLTLIAPPLLFAEVGEPYLAQLAATGGNGVYHWRLTAGSLPQGVFLDETSGSIAGRPAVVGTSSFTVAVVSGDAQSISKDVEVTVTGPLAGLTPVVPGGYVNEAYQVTLAAEGGDGDSYIWAVSSGALPPGVSLSQNGELSGDPSSSGVFEFTAEVTSGNRNASAGLTLTISTAPSSAYNISVHVTGAANPPAGFTHGGTTGAVVNQTVVTALEWALSRVSPIFS